MLSFLTSFLSSSARPTYRSQLVLRPARSLEQTDRFSQNASAFIELLGQETPARSFLPAAVSSPSTPAAVDLPPARLLCAGAVFNPIRSPFELARGSGSGEVGLRAREHSLELSSSANLWEAMSSRQAVNLEPTSRGDRVASASCCFSLRQEGR